MIAGEEAETDAHHRRIGPADVEHPVAQIAVVHVARRVGKLELRDQEIQVVDVAAGDGAEPDQSLDEHAGRNAIDPGEHLAAVGRQPAPVERRGRVAEQRVAVGEGESQPAGGVPVASAHFKSERRHRPLGSQGWPSGDAGARVGIETIRGRLAIRHDVRLRRSARLRRGAWLSPHDAVFDLLRIDEGRPLVHTRRLDVIETEVRPLRLVERDIRPLGAARRHALGGPRRDRRQHKPEHHNSARLPTCHQRPLSRTPEIWSELLSIRCALHCHRGARWLHR